MPSRTRCRNKDYYGKPVFPRLATPKQRRFLMRFCGFTENGAGDVSFDFARRLIRQKVETWKKAA